MKGPLKLYLFIFIAMLAGMVVNDFNKKEPIDWSPSFLSEHKKPFGTYVLFNELQNFFPNQNIEKKNISAYEYLAKKDSVLLDSNGEKSFVQYNLNKFESYIFINNSLQIDENAVYKLLDYVKEGKVVFMAANSFPRVLADSLHFETGKIISLESNIVYTKLVNKNISKQRFKYRKGVQNVYFNKLDTLTTTVLGFNKTENMRYNVNYIKVFYGDGYFLLNTQPYAFTNYQMLKSDHAKYVSASLSYLPDYDIVWDERIKAETEELRTPLRFILSKPSLKYAWFTALFTMFLYLFFRAKRRQRVVPVLESLPNTSVDFAKTIGNMYYQEGEPKDIIFKKITYFLEYLRTHYLLNTNKLDDAFIKRLQQKSGVSSTEINYLITFINNIKKRSKLEESTLVTLNKLIDNFYQKTIL